MASSSTVPSVTARLPDWRIVRQQGKKAADQTINPCAEARAATNEEPSLLAFIQHVCGHAQGLASAPNTRRSDNESYPPHLPKYSPRRAYRAAIGGRRRRDDEHAPEHASSGSAP
jgi:hypothetical protein